VGFLPSRLLLAAATALVALGLASPADATIAWGPCSDAGFAAFECASVNVPIDRSGGVPGTVPLFTRRLRATQGNPNNVALVALSGGPGQSAASSADDFALALATGLRERDLIVYDQRGTGQSGPLRCPALERQGTAPEVVGGCARELGAARGFYRTADSVEDLEALRVEGGYGKLALFGVSYGTKVALDYAARYPDRVERLVLDSIVPQDGPDPLIRSSIVAIRRLLGDLCGGGRCRRATPDPVGDLRRLVARGAQLRGTFVDARGRRRRGALDGAGLFAIFQAGDLNPAWRAQLPAAMRSAVRGDEAALLRLAVNVFGAPAGSTALIDPHKSPASRAPFQVRDAGTNSALFVATICEEVRFPWDRAASLQARVGQAEAALRGLGPDATTPFDQKTVAGAGLLSLCIGWPNAAPAPPAPGALPNVPALLLSGGADVRTPIEDVGAISSRLPGATPLSVPFVGHSVLGGDPSGCAKAAIAGFFNGNGVAPCQNRGPLITVGARSPASLSALPRSGGVPGRAGRTLTALLRTRDDSLLQATALQLAAETRSGGLRGGTIAVSDTGVRLRGVEVIRGVRVTGSFPNQGPLARLRVTGKSAARGSVTITRAGLIRGTLGGRRVRLTSPRARAASGAGPTWNTAAVADRLRPRF
jgi:pimeloyl-ACP methyl ester carboxylesterase